MSVSQRIKHYVDNVAHVERSQLAQKLHMTESGLSLLLNGKRRMTVETYEEICAVLCLDPCTFFRKDTP